MDFPNAMHQFAQAALAHMTENFHRVFIEGRRYHMEQHAHDCPIAVEARRRKQPPLSETQIMNELEAHLIISHLEYGARLPRILDKDPSPEVLDIIRLHSPHLLKPKTVTKVPRKRRAVIKDNSDSETAMAWSQGQETRTPEQERRHTRKDCLQTTFSVENETIKKVKK